MKCVNVVECALLVCVLCQPVSIHPPIPTFGRFLLEIFLNFFIYNIDNCTEGELRLVGGQTPNEGRVEICLDGQWGRVHV